LNQKHKLQGKRVWNLKIPGYFFFKRGKDMRKKRKVLDNSNDRRKMIDTERSVFIQGNLDDTLFSNLTPKIIALRKNSEKPITVFIDSPGGSLGVAGAIRGLLNAPDQMGRTCWINTVVTGRAFTAAAHLLTSGDYVISYPNANIHFHGTRTEVEGVTEEQAGKLQDEMFSINKSMATNLAAGVFNRMLLNYQSVRDQIPMIRETMGKKLKKNDVLAGDGTIDVPSFVYFIIDKVQEPHKELLLGCLCKTARLCSLVGKFHDLADYKRVLPSIVRSALKNIKNPKDGLSLGDELSLFNMLLESKIREYQDWRLTEEDFDELRQDFLQLNAMAYFQDEALDRLLRHSELFLSAKEFTFFEKHNFAFGDDPKIKKRVDGILERAYWRIEPLWSFSFTLCRELTRGEHPISPVDSWWFGLIDEVLGSPSLTRRTIRETVKDRLMENISVSNFDRLVDFEKIFGKG
jgi:ATP-dependent protease ClpP protease subunit